MILYFSATGNSRHVALRIADALGNKAISIEGLSPDLTIADGGYSAHHRHRYPDPLWLFTII